MRGYGGKVVGPEIGIIMSRGEYARGIRPFHKKEMSYIGIVYVFRASCPDLGLDS